MTTKASAVGIAGHEYARKVQVLIKLITELRALGAQADIDLPRIAVIGNQSAGKSSLVEAISGISVPRAAGTCTRCPMECRLTYSPGPFKCQVLLRIERDENGNPMPDGVKEEKFGPPLYDKSLLEDRLRRAQLAILNPSLPAETFVDLDLTTIKPGQQPHGSSRQLQFSANVVCLDLWSSEVTDLSFIDLPGIISNVSPGEDPSNIELIKGLVKEHISGNALILLTITMRDDIQNQSAALLAKAADPLGLRTIGVLTKPDTLQDGEHQAWLDVLSGRDHPLHHGYYVTKQPAIAELTENLDHKTAREREQQYFTRESPWNGVDAHVKSRMGVPNLTKELSRLLSQLIESTLPKLRSDSKTSLERCIREVRSLPPPPPESPISELLRLVSSFTADLSNYVWGQPSYETLIQSCRPAYAEFMKDILQTGPNFIAQVAKPGATANPGPQAKGAFLPSAPSTPAKLATAQIYATPMTTSTVPLSPTTKEIYETATVGSKGNTFSAGATFKVSSNLPFPFGIPAPPPPNAFNFGAKPSSNGQLAVNNTANFVASNAWMKSLAPTPPTAPSGEAPGPGIGWGGPKNNVPPQKANGARIPGTSALDPDVDGTQATATVEELLKNSSDKSKSVFGCPSLKDETENHSDEDEFASLNVRSKLPPMYLNDVRDFINRSLTRQLPLTIPHEAKARLIEQSFECWPLLSEKCFNAVHTAFRDCLDALVSEKFQRYTNGGLCEHVRNIVEKELEVVKKQSIERLNWLIDLESPPFTQNEHYYVDYKDKYLAQYRKQRGGKIRPSSEAVQAALAQLTALGLNVTALDLAKLQGPDVYEQELNLMAEVRAYFRVSYKRIIDNVPRVIDHDFLHEMRKRMQAALIKELGMGEHNAGQRAAAYLSEEPSIVVRRVELLQTKERLEGILEKLYRFTI